MKTLVIAEAGVNHNGEMSLAKEMVAAAAEAGADLVKFQTFRAGDLACRDAPKAEYQLSATGFEESQYEMVRRLELSMDDHAELVAECERKNIGFFSTAFDAVSFDMVDAIHPNRYVKIPSGEITNLPYLRHVASRGKYVLLSTGMANLSEIESAIRVIEEVGTSRDMITVLHCTTEYPAPMKNVNLCAMVNMGKAFGVKVGYSDHTRGVEISLAAVALGATVIEKHFTMSRDLPGPDHRASLEPGELKQLVNGIRNIEMAMGDGIKRPSPGEVANKLAARRSLVAARPITAGEEFTNENLTAKRPGSGISPMEWDRVIGSLAPRDFLQDELIKL